MTNKELLYAASTIWVVIAAVLLGVTCGILGCFMILRRQSLLGDAIGHSVLPGVCLGFLAVGTKSTPALLLGALIAGLLAAALALLISAACRFPLHGLAEPLLRSLTAPLSHANADPG